MIDPIELPTETRWRCQKCGKDFAEGRHVPFALSGLLGRLAGGSPYGLAPYTVEEPFLPLSGPLERGHEISWTTGGRAGVMGGRTRHTDLCGPLRLVEIDVQELFVEWWLQGAGGQR